jgi:transcriptional regulator with XRE-family HTH domain
MPKLKVAAIDKLIGKRIRKERRRQGLTLDEIAQKIGTTIAQLQHYETGKAALSVARLAAIAKALGRKTRFFIDGKE